MRFESEWVDKLVHVSKHGQGRLPTSSSHRDSRIRVVGEYRAEVLPGE